MTSYQEGAEHTQGEAKRMPITGAAKRGHRLCGHGTAIDTRDNARPANARFAGGAVVADAAEAGRAQYARHAGADVDRVGGGIFRCPARRRRPSRRFSGLSGAVAQRRVVSGCESAAGSLPQSPAHSAEGSAPRQISWSGMPL